MHFYVCFVLRNRSPVVPSSNTSGRFPFSHRVEIGIARFRGRLDSLHYAACFHFRDRFHRRRLYRISADTVTKWHQIPSVLMISIVLSSASLN